MEIDSSDSTNLRQLLQVLGNVLCHVRFFAISIEEFETDPAISGILPEEKIPIISTNLARKGSDECTFPCPPTCPTSLASEIGRTHSDWQKCVFSLYSATLKSNTQSWLRFRVCL